MNKENKDELKKTIYLQGMGTVSSVGELDMEKFVKRLLKSKFITGNLKK